MDLFKIFVVLLLGVLLYREFNRKNAVKIEGMDASEAGIEFDSTGIKFTKPVRFDGTLTANQPITANDIQTTRLKTNDIQTTRLTTNELTTNELTTNEIKTNETSGNKITFKNDVKFDSKIDTRYIGMNGLRIDSDGTHLVFGIENGCNIMYARNDGQLFTGTGNVGRLTRYSNNGCNGA